MTHNTLPPYYLARYLFNWGSCGETASCLLTLQPIELFLPQIIQPTYYRERSQTAIIIILSEGF